MLPLWHEFLGSWLFCFCLGDGGIPLFQSLELYQPVAKKSTAPAPVDLA